MDCRNTKAISSIHTRPFFFSLLPLHLHLHNKQFFLFRPLSFLVAFKNQFKSKKRDESKKKNKKKKRLFKIKNTKNCKGGDCSHASKISPIPRNSFLILPTSVDPPPPPSSVNLCLFLFCWFVSFPTRAL